MESDLSTVNEEKNQFVDEKVGIVEEQMKNIDLEHEESLKHEEGLSESINVTKNDDEEESKVLLDNCKNDKEGTVGQSAKLENIVDNLNDVELKGGKSERKESVSKTVGLGVAEEGELDYEEEVPEEEHRVEQKVDNEELETDDKDCDGEKDDEGSEEGEIVTDEEDDVSKVKDNEQKVLVFKHKYNV